MTAPNDDKRHRILTKLADGQFHSGEELGAELGISRAAISKHIKALEGLGLEIFSVTGKGYRLASKLDLLDPSLINAARRFSDKPLTVLSVVDSTNTYLKLKQSAHRNGAACLAEAQTAGRGRQGRKWQSPFGASLYLSMYWTFSGGYQAIGGLSLMIGVAVVEALNRLGVEGLQLKWPNDIYLDGKKLGGVLVEVEGQIHDQSHCIVGVGLNIRLPDLVREEIDQPYTDLAQHVTRLPDRNLLAAAVLDELQENLIRFEHEGLAAFLPRWEALNLFKARKIKMLCGSNHFEGVCLGVNKDGALLVRLPDGVKAFYGGEVSVRSAH
ncbi:bifunctional biotin--[acetyl-CoA-carboxylase] ligase/biotin operon repressor BirA [Bowmanella pacifica]|uniref:Bifunctional ligase/repressor BirA n=1 Tax=Bowmanella pacifica TaxID=502051 RepID=A0A917Z6H4_9ALTE|nr:bifunctional biotin--[acetyl-CoA-carboxylase] ligase/biotin operon repressor BirA [Bowmanella pacifica]GGO75328.1 bifunctional ligase/repressor BirA [Bowmanella pacifica]